MKKNTLYATLALLFASALAYSAGFTILEQSTIGMGRSLAGMTAETNEPSALYFNPSSTAWFTRPSVHIGLHILSGDVRITSNEGASTLPGRDSGDLEGVAYIPNFSLVYPLKDRLTLNLTSSATSGARTEYPSDWKGKYFAIDSSVAVMEIQPSLSYRVLDNLSFAVGFMAQYAQISMERAIAPALGNTTMKLEGDGWAYGYTLGLTWKALEKTTVGLSYRSRMEHKVTTRAKYNGPGVGFLPFLGLTDKADMTVIMPQSVNFGVIQELTDKWRVMTDIAWTDWSTTREIKTEFRNGSTQYQPLNWHDSWRFALGTDYKLTDKWTVSFGVAFDEEATPTPNKVCMLPDCNRYWISAGVAYQMTENLRFDLSWMHLTYKRSRIHEEIPGAPGQYIDGEVYGYSDLCSFGLKYDF